MAIPSSARVASAIRTTSSNRISHLVLDFDETLTTFDTISALAATAYNFSPPRPSIPPWSHFTAAYIRDYRAHVDQLPPASTRTNISEELSFLSSLLPVERASIERIETAGVFKGLRISDIVDSAKASVRLRDGVWRYLLKAANENNTRVAVLSVNWSTVWIREALTEGVRKAGGNPEDITIDIICNDLETDRDGVMTTGAMSRASGCDEGIWTAAHKTTAFEKYLEGHFEKETVVYVGDSATDLGVLLAANVGIVVGNKLDSTCARIGIDLVSGVPLQEYQTLGKDYQQPTLFRVQDMKELGRLWQLRS